MAGEPIVTVDDVVAGVDPPRPAFSPDPTVAPGPARPGDEPPYSATAWK